MSGQSKYFAGLQGVGMTDHFIDIRLNEGRLRHCRVEMQPTTPPTAETTARTLNAARLHGP